MLVRCCTYPAQIARLVPLRELDSDTMIDAKGLENCALGFLDVGCSLASKGLSNLSHRRALAVHTTNEPKAYRPCQKGFGGWNYFISDQALTLALGWLHAADSVKDTCSSSSLHGGMSIARVLGQTSRVS